MVSLVEAEFWEGTVVKKCTGYMVVLILKGRWYLRGIGLVEVLWKMVKGILNWIFTTDIGFHDTLHGFMVGREVSTASIETKLLQNMTTTSEAFLYEIILDLQKALNALNKDPLLQILPGYGVGPWEIRILWRYWGRLTMMAKYVGYHSPPFKGFRGVTQGNPHSPTTFNVVMDTVVHHWVTAVAAELTGPEGLRRLIKHLVEYL